MATSPLLGIDTAPAQAGGRDVEALGPSDSSDSGSDIQGELDLEGHSDREERLGAGHTDRGSDSDAEGTGERGSALLDEDVEEGSDISPDHIEVIGPDVEADENDVPAGLVHGEAAEIEADAAYDEDEDGDDETDEERG